MNAGVCCRSTGRRVSAVVQTAMAGDDQTRPSCASATGGQDGVVDFQVPATGRRDDAVGAGRRSRLRALRRRGHAARLRRGSPRACVVRRDGDRRPRVLGLPPGRYHLVVDADRRPRGRRGAAADRGRSICRSADPTVARLFPPRLAPLGCYARPAGYSDRHAGGARLRSSATGRGRPRSGALFPASRRTPGRPRPGTKSRRAPACANRAAARGPA